ncbi:MAG: Gfo/Idh/MocA family oxidoreductase [Acidimicrobiia bacterium]|nr:Gfo/Idh/MocA family oxidoreductase [Acidimicrobiia bacterium]
MTTSTPVRFAVVGLEHPHAYGLSLSLLGAGAELVAFHSDNADGAASFAQLFASAERRDRVDQIIDDPGIDVVVPVGVPADRAAVAVAAMRAGKDVLADKPAVTTLDQLHSVATTQADTGQIWSVYFSERLESRATIRAAQLVASGAVGTVAQVIGLGPHRLDLDTRPEWFLDPARTPGIIADLATHQIDQFVHFTGADVDAVEIVASMVANNAHPVHPTLEDYGEVVLRAGTSSGLVRVDWYTPDGLPSWGDVRLLVHGTEGSIEVRKNVDPGGRTGGDHLLLVDQRGVRRFDCARDPLPFAGQFLDDVRHRTAVHLDQREVIGACELALRAQVGAERRGHLRSAS